METDHTTSVYDTAGRVVVSINPLGKRTTTVYNTASQNLAMIDANGNRVSSVYDALRRRTVEINNSATARRQLCHRGSNVGTGGRPQQPAQFHI
ncbi:MAG: hypothetical protein WKF77_31065 [Planctomycetaceae bacterium]